MWLSLISVILAKLAVGDSHIRRVWVLNFFLQRGTAILHVFWVYAKHLRFPSKSTHSEQPWQISFNARRTHHHLHIDTHRQYILSSTPPFFFLFFCGYHAVAAHERKSALICKSEQAFHGANLCDIPVPEWELLISPGRLAYNQTAGRREWAQESGSPLRAWQVADKSSSRRSCMHLLPLLLVSPLLRRSHADMRTPTAFFTAHVRH